ncbi:MAG TPA: ferric reductase-like transmembrane domain-containing protein [Candidatus Dormibacteraeota bacterium]|nr:ferric reductase-like transmembrane domain-containing protein [Candidatus Dormibacteraeota bacterium]
MKAQWQKVRYGYGPVLGLIICLIPLVLWLPRQPIDSYFSEPSIIFATLAKICSLTGIAMFAWALILSARLRFLERAHNGLDKVYRYHHIFGGLAFILIMLHPVFLTLKFEAIASGLSAELWWSGNFSLVLGRLALAVMVFALIFAYFIKLKHLAWVRVHRILGLVFIIGSWHALAVRGQLDVNPPLFSYMLTLMSLGSLAYFYHSIFGTLLIKRFRYTVERVERPARDITEIILKPKRWPIIFTPGQFAFVSVRDPHVDTEAHPYSFAGSSHERSVRFVVKALGDHTRKLEDVLPGSEVILEGPYGRFSHLNMSKRRQIWVAGGIGITPFLSMAHSLSARYKVDLYDCNKTAGEAVYAKELQALADKNPNFRLIQVCEDEDGFVSAQMIKEASGDLTNADILICGPPQMADALMGQFEDLGIDPDRLHFEDFRY